MCSVVNTPVEVTTYFGDTEVLSIIHCDRIEQWYYSFNTHFGLDLNKVTKTLQSQGRYTKLFLNDEGEVIYELNITLEE